MPDSNKPINVAENLVADKGTMTVSTKLMKYAVGTLVGGTISILMFAYGLYWKAEDNRKAADKDLIEMVTKDKMQILTAIKELEKEEIKPNTKKNYDQDMKIMLVMERTNTLGERVNGNYQRPPSIASNPPSRPERIEVEFVPVSNFMIQNIVSNDSISE